MLRKPMLVQEGDKSLQCIVNVNKNRLWDGSVTVNGFLKGVFVVLWRGVVPVQLAG